jgi:hypothetical protein
LRASAPAGYEISSIHSKGDRPSMCNCLRFMLSTLNYPLLRHKEMKSQQTSAYRGR